VKSKVCILWLFSITFIGVTGCVPRETLTAENPTAHPEIVAELPTKGKLPAEAESTASLNKPADAVPEPANPAISDSGALESAEAVMNWYIGYMKDHQSSSGEILYPFEEGAHRENDLFTDAYINMVDEILAIPVLERGLFDPVMHQWGFIDKFSLELVSLDERAATIAVKLDSSDLPSWAGATLDLIQTDTGWKVQDIRQENIATPVGVTKLFYDWYLGYFKISGNPLKDEAYKSSEYLSDSLIAMVAEGQTGFDQNAIDPFVLSPDIPTGYSILEEAVLRSNRATVILWRYLYSSQSQPLVVHLENFNRTWKIIDVALEEVPLNPTKVVEAFYGWYLDYTKADSDGNFRNALVDKAYQDSPYLAEAFIKKLDLWDHSHDPLLCAQDIPTSIVTDGYFVEKLHGPQDITDASVVVRASFPGHIFTVDLTRPGGIEDEWKIKDVTCSFSPGGTVKAFYTWYQSCTEGSPACRAPAASETYASSGLVTSEFVDKVKALREEFTKSGGGGYDPILMAQSQLYTFDVVNVYEVNSPAAVSSKARVFLRNLSMEGLDLAEQGLLVTLVVDGSYWKIDNVTAYFPNTPEQIAIKFYTWYMDILRAQRNPQVVYGFEPEAYLSTNYLIEVRSALNSERMEGYNLILLSDRLPEMMDVGEVKVENNTATLIVLRYYEGEDSPSSMTVFMEKKDGWWVITGAEEK
jgi:hypothetical protein